MNRYGWEWDGSLSYVAHWKATRKITDDLGDLYTVHRCSMCRGWQRACEENFIPVARYDSGVVKRWDTACRSCRRIERRAYYQSSPEQQRKQQERARLARKDPVRREKILDYKRRYNRKSPEVRKRQDRVYYAALREDPVRWAKRLADQRMNYRLRKEREGREVRNDNVRLGRGRGSEMAKLPVAPLLAFLEPKAIVYEGLGKNFKISLKEREARWAEVMGVSLKTYFEWREGVRKTAQFDTVDRLLVTNNVNWHDVYGPPANGHKAGRPQDVLCYIAEAEEYLRTVKVFVGEETLDYVSER